MPYMDELLYRKFNHNIYMLDNDSIQKVSLKITCMLDNDIIQKIEI